MASASSTSYQQVEHVYLGTGNEQLVYDETKLRTRINGRVASFVKTDCSHKLLKDCQCLRPSHEVLKEYFFTVLKTQQVTAGNFDTLFCIAHQSRSNSSQEIDFERNPCIAVPQTSFTVKNILIIIGVAACVAAIFATSGVFAYKVLFKKY